MGFLAGLEAGNSRDWFAAHRAAYEALWLNPGLDLAAALSGPVAQMGLMAVPKLRGSIRRNNRDVRFPNAKRLITRIGIWFCRRFQNRAGLRLARCRGCIW